MQVTTIHNPARPGSTTGLIAEFQRKINTG